MVADQTNIKKGLNEEENSILVVDDSFSGRGTTADANILLDEDLSLTNMSVSESIAEVVTLEESTNVIVDSEDGSKKSQKLGDGKSDPQKKTSVRNSREVLNEKANFYCTMW